MVGVAVPEGGKKGPLKEGVRGIEPSLVLPNEVNEIRRFKKLPQVKAKSRSGPITPGTTTTTTTTTECDDVIYSDDYFDSLLGGTIVGNIKSCYISIYTL